MRFCHPEERPMAENVYKVLELIGTSTESWGRAASVAVERAAGTLRDLRVAEVVEQDLQITADGKVEAFRVKLKLSFKDEAGDKAGCEAISMRHHANSRSSSQLTH